MWRPPKKKTPHSQRCVTSILKSAVPKYLHQGKLCRSCQDLPLLIRDKNMGIRQCSHFESIVNYKSYVLRGCSYPCRYSLVIGVTVWVMNFSFLWIDCTVTTVFILNEVNCYSTTSWIILDGVNKTNGAIQILFL